MHRLHRFYVDLQAIEVASPLRPQLEAKTFAVVLRACLSTKTKPRHNELWRGLWLGCRDSNPDRQSQNLQSYR